jgi:hypothetical protein
LRNLGAKFNIELNEGTTDNEGEYRSFRGAIYRNIKTGNLEILQYLNQIEIFDDYENDQYTIGAAQFGYLDILIWLRSKGFAWNQRVMTNAIQFGYFEIAKWAHDNGLELNRPGVRVTNPGPYLALKGHYYDIFFWLIENHVQMSTSVLYQALVNSDFKLAEWILDQWTTPIPLSGKDYLAACENGDRRVIEWLDQYKIPGPRIYPSSVATNGEFEIIKELIERTDKPKSKFNLFSLLIGNYFEILKYLVDQTKVTSFPDREQRQLIKKFAYRFVNNRLQMLKPEEYKIIIFIL